MAMRNLVTRMGLGLTLALGACSGAPGEGTVLSDLIKDHCPDPTVGCTMTNGTGVYYAEDGFAGIDTLQLMITRFVNKGTSVSVQGRYFNAAKNMWLPNTGVIRSAGFRGVWSYRVQSVSERGTYPVWTLIDATTNSAITVGGAELASLQLNVDFPDPTGKIDTWILDFGTQIVETRADGNNIYQYVLRWHAWNVNNPAHPYCLDASNNEDPVVFQGGIDVNPVNGAVTRNLATAADVTLSCRGGAIATVYDWGYDYLGNNLTWYFDAGIQMKRASYCADGQHYTKAGTKIEVSDGAGIRNEVLYSWQDPSIEAYWLPSGASCLGKMRHPELGFDGFCNGQKLPACPDIVAVEAAHIQFLVDAVP
jgi:hypothetical protein